MSTLRLYTTPTFTLHIPGVDLTAFDLYVTFRQGDTVVTKNDGVATYSGDETQIVVSLTQAESGQFKDRPGIYVQVNWMNGATREATNIAELPPRSNLLEEVIS